MYIAFVQKESLLIDRCRLAKDRLAKKTEKIFLIFS